MTRILGIGDNCVDIYVDQGIQFPGGNAVNVAVFCKRCGADTAYLGCIGNDALGGLIRKSLVKEQVEIDRLRIGKTVTPWTKVRHSNGDRYFEDSQLPNPDDYNLQDDDFDYITGFDLVHSSVYSKLDAEIEKISVSAKLLSFDFSNKFQDQNFEIIAPHIDIAILSEADASQKAVKALCKDTAALGPSTVIVTRGSRGAICFHKGEIHSQSVVPAKVIDTLGAGDGFIAGFLFAMLNGAAISEAMVNAAKYAADVCSYQGAFGHGVDLIF